MLKVVSLAFLVVALLASPALAQVAIQGQGQQQGQGQEQEQNQIQLQGQDQGNVQSVTTTGVPNLIQLPGLLNMPPNFTQPYKPEVFLNGAGPVRPAKMTYEQAMACAGYWGFSDNWYGPSQPASTEIALYYPAWDKVAPTGDMSAYLGTATVSAADKPWVPILCTAAKAAMENGVDVGVVEYIVRPRNDTWGIGFGSSFGGSGMPAAAANPYALAGVAGIGTGFSRTHVKGELMLQITGMKKGTVKTSDGKPLGEPRLGALPPNGNAVLSDLRQNLRRQILQSRGIESNTP